MLTTVVWWHHHHPHNSPGPASDNSENQSLLVLIKFST